MIIDKKDRGITMKKVLRIIRNIIFGVIFVVYLSIIICVSTLVLNRNDYGYTEFGNKALIDIKENTGNYLKGQLVIVEKKIIDNLKAGDEVFVYETNQQEKTVKVVSSTIKEINKEETTPYITLDVDNTAWGQDYIAGQSTKMYESIGGILTFVESKWIFFVIFIIPCFFILLYEIYSVIIVIKFDGDEAILENPNVISGDQKDKVDDISVLMSEITNLKSQLNQNAQPIMNQNLTQQSMQPQTIGINSANAQVQPQAAGVNNINAQVQPQAAGVNNINAQVQPQAAGVNNINAQAQPQVGGVNNINAQMQPQVGGVDNINAQVQPSQNTNIANSNSEQPQIIQTSAQTLDSQNNQ